MEKNVNQTADLCLATIIWFVKKHIYIYGNDVLFLVIEMREWQLFYYDIFVPEIVNEYHVGDKPR